MISIVVSKVSSKVNDAEQFIKSYLYSIWKVFHRKFCLFLNFWKNLFWIGWMISCSTLLCASCFTLLQGKGQLAGEGDFASINRARDVRSWKIREKLKIRDFRIHEILVYFHFTSLLVLTSSFSSSSSLHWDFPSSFRAAWHLQHRFHSYNIGDNLLYHLVTPEARVFFRFTGRRAPYGRKDSVSCLDPSSVSSAPHLAAHFHSSRPVLNLLSFFPHRATAEISQECVRRRRAFENRKASTTPRRFY